MPAKYAQNVQNCQYNRVSNEYASKILGQAVSIIMSSFWILTETLVNALGKVVNKPLMRSYL